MKLGVVGGAGLLGSTSAFLAGTKGYLDEIKIIDIKENLAKSHVLDMGQAIFSASGTVVSYGEYKDLADCGIILISASIPERQVADRMEYLRDNIKIVKPICEQIKANCNEAVIINATNPVDIFNYIIWKILGWDRKKILGFNGNDTYRLKWAAAEVTKKDIKKIDGFCIGEHGNGQVNLYDQMTYEDLPLNLSAEEIKNIENMTSNFFTAFQSLNSGRTSGWTSSINIEELIEAVATNSGKVIECSSVLLGEYGYNGVSFGVPVSVGSEGIISYEMPELTSEQKNKLDGISAKLADTLSKIEY